MCPAAKYSLQKTAAYADRGIRRLVTNPSKHRRAVSSKRRGQVRCSLRDQRRYLSCDHSLSALRSRNQCIGSSAPCAEGQTIMAS